MKDLNLTSQADLERACAALAAMNAPQLPMMRAAADGLLALIHISDPRAPWPEKELATLRRPVLLVIGDDLEPVRASSPPSSWRCAAQLRQWAISAIVHGAAAEAQHYRLATIAALTAGRATLIETNSACVRQWGEFLSPTPVIAFLPRSGPHPVDTSQEAFH